MPKRLKTYNTECQKHRKLIVLNSENIMLILILKFEWPKRSHFIREKSCYVIKNIILIDIIIETDSQLASLKKRLSRFESNVADYMILVIFQLNSS
jgi:hypothetical protein